MGESPGKMVRRPALGCSPTRKRPAARGVAKCQPNGAPTNQSSESSSRSRLSLVEAAFRRAAIVPGEVQKLSALAAFCLLLITVAACRPADAQTREWAWMSGSKVVPSANLGQLGVYGTLGVPAPGNTPGGRDLAVTWTDTHGNLWLFGGLGFASLNFSGALNDLWKFNPSTRKWTWMGGSNVIGDNDGHAGVYGTLGVPAATNFPGSRFGASAWTDDNGNFWLLGGDGFDGAGHDVILNDLWRFNPSTLEWTWMGGTSTVPSAGSVPGVYGTLGIPAVGNVPGSREDAVSWTDHNGNLWLFGGDGFDSANNFADLNDLWEFNPSTNEWTWMGGSKTVPPVNNNLGANPGVYGTLGLAAAGNFPGGRFFAASWTDGDGHLWLFGGHGFDSAGTPGDLNDFWEFNPSTREWTWMGGSNTVPDPNSGSMGNAGVYGTRGVPAAGNIPGSRLVPSFWTDNNGNLWLAGGRGYDSTGRVGHLNDVWEFGPTTQEWTWVGGSNAVPASNVFDTGQPGVYGTLGVPAAANIPGGRASAAHWTDPAGNLWLFGGGGFDSNDTVGVLNDLWEYTTVATTAAKPMFNPPAGTYTSAQSVSISDTTPGATIHFTTDGTTPTANSAVFTRAIAVSRTTTIKAIAVAAGLSNSSVATATYTIALSAAVPPVFTPGAGTYTSAQSVTLTDATAGATIFYTTDGRPPTTNSTRFTTAINVSRTTTIKAIAVAPGVENSSVASATYTIIAVPPPAALQFVPVTPCRIADTRNASGPFGGPQLAAGTSREFDIPQSACAIPSSAVAYSLNVTAVPGGRLNFLTLWPSGQPRPNVSTLNSDGRIKANAAITPAGTNGGVSVFASDATHVILDIDGYFVPAGTASALAFYPVAPCRLADTRGPGGPLGGPFIAGRTSRNFSVVSGTCNIPSTAKAYSLNVTAVPHTTLNFLTVWPAGQAQPNVSTLNSPTGAVTANAAIVPAGSGGEVSIFAHDDADVILDVNGYFAPPAAGGLSLFTVAPCRVIDTRPTAFNGTKVVDVAGSTCAPPSTARAFVLNATVVPPGALNYLSLWPDGEVQPNVSTLNALDGAITSNMAIVPTSNGSIDAFGFNPTNLILDLTSYFAP